MPTEVYASTITDRRKPSGCRIEKRARSRSSAAAARVTLRDLHPQVDQRRADRDFKSLDAQREACAAYIKSQRHEGWKLVGMRYDNGGLSGATMEHPALARLREEIRALLRDRDIPLS